MNGVSIDPTLVKIWSSPSIIPVYTDRKLFIIQKDARVDNKDLLHHHTCVWAYIKSTQWKWWKHSVSVDHRDIIISIQHAFNKVYFKNDVFFFKNLNSFLTVRYRGSESFVSLLQIVTVCQAQYDGFFGGGYFGFVSANSNVFSLKFNWLFLFVRLRDYSSDPFRPWSISKAQPNFRELAVNFTSLRRRQVDPSSLEELFRVWLPAFTEFTFTNSATYPTIAMRQVRISILST